jgi:hypothetical protein
MLKQLTKPKRTCKIKDDDEGAGHTMKMGSRLIVVAATLVALAAPAAFARSQQHPDLDSQEMTITNSPSGDLIVTPPVTRPEGSNYDTPRPRIAPVVAIAPAPAQDATSAPVVDGVAAAASKATDDASAEAPAHLDGVQTAAASVPSSADDKDAKKEFVGPMPPARTPGAILFDQTHDDSAMDPLSWSVNVFKARHELAVYYKGRLFKRYDAVFGRNLDNGAKQWAQDRRTPEGVYCILEKYPSSRFRWFMRLNYPNLVDRVRYEMLRINGVVPIGQDGKAPEVGSAIGIHGTDVPVLNAGHINWTTGCISLSNKDIDDLERLLPVGTVVIIKP